MRLTSFYRNQILKAAVDFTFDPKFVALKQAEHVLGMRFYKKLFSETERRQVAKLSKRWVSEDTCLRFNFAGRVLSFTVDEPVRVPANDGYCRSLGGLLDPVDVEAAVAHHDAVQELEKAKDKAYRTLRAMLNSITTLAALADIWPEGRPFYENLQPSANLPAPVVADVNALFDLPVAA